MDNKCLHRAKRKDNGEWVEGFLMDDNYINVPFNDNDIGGRFDDPVEIDPSTICQCTDLPDENVRKIFEGDIVKSDSAIGIVKFGRYGNGFHYGYYVDWVSDTALRPELGFWNGRSRIVGNVFDNPNPWALAQAKQSAQDCRCDFVRQIEKKALPQYFEAVLQEEKHFELRKDEDDVQPGDMLILREWDNETGYTGRSVSRVARYVLRNVPEYGLMDGYCIVGF